LVFCTKKNLATLVHHAFLHCASAILRN
jgi:hypothetical protein